MITLLIYRFLESYFRHRWWYLLPIVLMIVAAGVFITTSKPKYIARGSIYVQKETFLSALNSVTPENTSWWTTPAQSVTNEITELLRTDAFIRAVIHDTALEDKMDEGSEVVSETIKEARESVWIAPLGENQIQINAAHEEAEIAHQIANSVLSSFVQWQVNAQRTEGEAALTFFADLIKVYQANLETARESLKNYLQENPPPLRGERNEIQILEIGRLQGDVEIARARYTNALEKEENARLALAQIEGDTRQSYTIIDAPLLPEKPEVSRRQLAIQAGIFLLVGVILSIAAIAGNMILDRTFRFPIDVYYGTHLPVLAMIPDTTEKTTRLQRLKQRLGRKKMDGVEATAEENVPGDDKNKSEQAGKTKFSWFQRRKQRAASRIEPSAEEESAPEPDDEQPQPSEPERIQAQEKTSRRNARKKAQPSSSVPVEDSVDSRNDGNEFQEEPEGQDSKVGTDISA